MPSGSISLHEDDVATAIGTQLSRRSPTTVNSNQREQKWGNQMRAGLAGNETEYRSLLNSLTIFLRSDVRRSFARYGRGTADVEDVVQEALLAIHLKRETWRPEELISPWVRAIARNKFIDSLRRSGRQIMVPLDKVIDFLPAAEHEDRITEQESDYVLSKLKGRQRDVVESVSINGRSIRETAVEYSLSEGAVRVALHRGLTSLSKAYRENEVRS